MDDGSCDYGNADCADPCAPVLGCTDATACNYNVDACVSDDTCVYAEGCDECSGETDGTGTVIDNPEVGESCDDGDATTINDVIQADCGCAGESALTGCTDMTACNYDSAAMLDDESCVYAEGCDTCSGETDGSGTVIDNPEVGESCNDGNPNTMNDTVSATCDCIGEAIVMGCTEPDACNFNADANMEDGSCLAPGDACDDGDATTTGDVLQDDCSCSGVSVPGCTNSLACNYSEMATVDDGSCIVPGDSCDDGDMDTENDVIQDDCSCTGTPVAAGCSPGVGLENIIVETYYVSDANDATDEDGGSDLPVGSVTYRVFVDMAAGWSMESIFGNSDHDLVFGTTSEFYNQEDRGEQTGEEIADNRLDENTLALDSWLSMGGASESHLGVPKVLDTDGSIIGGVNNDGGSEVIAGGLLVNDDMAAGIPLTTADGLISGTPAGTDFIGDLGGLAGTYFGDENAAGTFISQNGAYAVLGGTPGATADNVLLIGQFTTDGIFNFELNFRIGGPGDSFEQYTSSNPVIIQGGGGQSEIQCDLLSYTSAPQIVQFQDPINILTYPNPNDGTGVTLKFDDLPGEGELVTMELVDMFGRSISMGQFTNVNQTTVFRTIDFEQQLQEGIYLVRVRYNGLTETQKIIVSK
jgi:hypothetical protein